MDLARLTIRAENGQGKYEEIVKALFNPNQISISKSTKWREIPQGESDTLKAAFAYGEPANLSMELFFDTYEASQPVKRDVRKYTQKLFYLMTVQEHGDLHRPPLCKLEWGAFNISSDYHCNWILQSLNQRFTLFLSNGTPVRATVACTFRQWRSDKDEALLLNKKSTDVAKKRIVRSGDTLSSIAGEEYNDPTLWRPIAENNRIDNPRNLTPGNSLTIPALRSRDSASR